MSGNKGQTLVSFDPNGRFVDRIVNPSPTCGHVDSVRIC